MTAGRRNYQQPPDIGFVVTDGDDEDEPIIGPDGSPPRLTERPARPARPIGLRWCLPAAVLAVLAVLAGGLFYAHRSRTIVSTRVISTPPGQATADLTGCPLSATCSALDLPDQSVLFGPVARYLPGASLVRGNSVYDSDSGLGYRSDVVVRTLDRVLVTLTASYDPDGLAVPAWRSALPAVGPAEVTLVVPGSRRGSALAVSASVPAGTPVPVAALRALAADQSLQLPRS